MKKLMIIVLVVVLAVMFSFPASLFATTPTSSLSVTAPCIGEGEETSEVKFQMQRSQLFGFGSYWRLQLDGTTIWGKQWVSSGSNITRETTKALEADTYTATFQTRTMLGSWTTRATKDFTVEECGPPENPAISLTKTASPTTANPGDTITYTITVENIGNVDFSSVAISDPMIDMIVIIIEPLAVGSGPQIYNPTYLIPDDYTGELTNTATVEAWYGEGQGNFVKDEASATVTVTALEEDPEPDPTPAAVVEVEAAVDEPEIEVLAEVEEPSRTKPLTVWHVGCNDDGKLEFIFLYPYRDNNWLTIYDAAGNEVYREDISYSNPRTVVDLPDGMYTVKTFKSEGRIIQEFSIGLPCDAAAPVAVKDVAELPYTGFNYLPYSIAAAILAGLAGMLIAFRKRIFKTANK